MVFLTFLKFSLKFREQIPCREAASNALREGQIVNFERTYIQHDFQSDSTFEILELELDRRGKNKNRSSCTKRISFNDENMFFVFIFN
jgi:hypothetical protein